MQHVMFFSNTTVSKDDQYNVAITEPTEKVGFRVQKSVLW